MDDRIARAQRGTLKPNAFLLYQLCLSIRFLFVYLISHDLKLVKKEQRNEKFM